MLVHSFFILWCSRLYWCDWFSYCFSYFSLLRLGYLFQSILLFNCWVLSIKNINFKLLFLLDQAVFFFPFLFLYLCSFAFWYCVFGSCYEWSWYKHKKVALYSILLNKLMLKYTKMWLKSFLFWKKF